MAFLRAALSRTMTFNSQACQLRRMLHTEAKQKDFSTAVIKREHWLKENIHGPLQRAAKSLGTVAWLADHQCTAPNFRNQKLALENVKGGYNLGYQYGIKRHARLNLTPNKTIVMDTVPGVWHMVKEVDRVSVGHFHYDRRPGLKCWLDPTVKNESDISCYYVIVHNDSASNVKKYFSDYSPEWAP